MHVDNKGKYILIFSEGPTQGLDDTTLTAETNYPINFTQSNRRFILSINYNRSGSFLFVDPTKIYKFKAKDWEIKEYPLCLGNVSKDFTIDNMKKSEIKVKYNFFSVNYRSINTNEIIDIHKYLINKIIKKMFIMVLLSIINASNLTKWSLSNQNCKIQPTICNLHN